GRVVLDPHLAHAQPRGQTIGADERRAAGGQPGAGARLRAFEGQEVVIAPDVLRPALDAPARMLDVLDVVLVGDLERPEAALADVPRLEPVVRPALLTRQLRGSHDEKSSAGIRSWRRSRKASATSLRN